MDEANDRGELFASPNAPRHESEPAHASIELPHRSESISKNENNESNDGSSHGEARPGSPAERTLQPSALGNEPPTSPITIEDAAPVHATVEREPQPSTLGNEPPVAPILIEDAAPVGSPVERNLETSTLDNGPSVAPITIEDAASVGSPVERNPQSSTLSKEPSVAPIIIEDAAPIGKPLPCQVSRRLILFVLISRLSDNPGRDTMPPPERPRVRNADNDANQNPTATNNQATYWNDPAIRQESPLFFPRSRQQTVEPVPWPRSSVPRTLHPQFREGSRDPIRNESPLFVDSRQQTVEPLPEPQPEPEPQPQPQPPPPTSALRESSRDVAGAEPSLFVGDGEETVELQQRQQREQRSPRPRHQPEPDMMMSGALQGDVDQPQDAPAVLDSETHALIVALEGIRQERDARPESHNSTPAPEARSEGDDNNNNNDADAGHEEEQSGTSESPPPMNEAAAYMRRANQKQQGLRKRKRGGHGRDSRSGTPAGPAVHKVHGFEIESYHPSRLEMPTRTDFLTPYARLNADLFKWGPPRKDMEGIATTMIARPPSIPDPMANEPNGRGRFQTAPRVVEEDEDEEAEDQETRTTPSPKPPAPVTLSTLPAEVRLDIFRRLLVSTRPIIVHKGWEELCRRERDPLTGRNRLLDFGLAPRVLEVCKKFFEEGVKILYGENTFKYRLRDLLAPPPVNVEMLPHNDNVESGSEYEPDEGEVARPPAKKPRRGKKSSKTDDFKGDINVEKYMPLIRHISLDAQHNRAGKDFMHSMAEAIGVFAKHAGATGGTISSLKVIIRPSHGSNQQISFTFVDFFHPNSPVMGAIRRLKPEFMHTDIMSLFLNGGRKNRRLTIDMRPQRTLARILAGGEDEWENDLAMKEMRFVKVKQSMTALKELSLHVGSCCQEYTEGEGPRNAEFFWFSEFGVDDEFDNDPDDPYDLDDMESQYWE